MLLSWGVPGLGAISVATAPQQPAQMAIFAYPKGAMMVGMTAPDKRIGFFAIDNPGTANLTPEGLKLLDAAIDWAIN